MLSDSYPDERRNRQSRALSASRARAGPILVSLSLSVAYDPQPALQVQVQALARLMPPSPRAEPQLEVTASGSLPFKLIGPGPSRGQARA